MNYRIKNKESFRIVGVSEPLEAESEKNFEIILNMWDTAAMNGTISRLDSMMEGMPMRMLGVSACNESDNWRYYISVASSQPIENNLEKYIIPSFLWEIFSGEDSAQSIQELEKRIVTEWLPTSGYKYENAPYIEVYLNADPENTQYKVWIPVSKKGKLSIIYLVYCDDKEKVLERILAGSKRMIIIGAAGRKIPHSRVFIGEKLYFMKKGTAKISATATVKSVQNFTKSSEYEIVKVLHL